jgi:hypothetical protein
MNIAHGFIPVVMESAGAKNIHIQIGQSEIERDHHGIPLMRSSFVVTWTA